MGPKKRSKVYSRTFVGCWTCRRRKIKCDATRPSCKRCAKSKVECEGYDVKLTWSAPLISENGELKTLGIDSEDHSELDEQTSSQRSRVELCRWDIYQYYEQIDDDINILENNRVNKVGPFTVFGYQTQPIELDDKGNDQDVSGVEKISLVTSQKKVKKLLFAEIPDQPQELLQHNLREVSIHPSLSKLYKLTEQILNEPSSDIRQSPELEIKIQDSFVSFASSLKDHITNFISNTNRIFSGDESFHISVKAIIKENFGSYVLYQTRLSLLLLYCIIMISKLLTASVNPKTCDEITKLKKCIDGLYEKSKVEIKESKSIPLTLILMIMINSSLGIYNPDLFKYEIYESGTIPQLYQYYQSVNNLLNSSQYHVEPKYQTLYEDVDPSYNLLKTFDSSSKEFQNAYGIIQISSQETPRDQIIKIPKYRTDDDHDGDDDEDDEHPPPTFVVNFSNGDLSNEDDPADAQDDESDEADVFFSLENMDVEQQSSNGLSKCLVYLFKELSAIINHKRYFVHLNKRSRNFPKVCADFEDVLLKANKLHSQSKIDKAFYNSMIVLYYTFIANYPSRALAYHFNQLKEFLKHCDFENQISRLVWFIRFALMNSDTNCSIIMQDDKIWGNNWVSKQIIYEMNQLKLDGDWDPILKSKKLNFFI